MITVVRNDFKLGIYHERTWVIFFGWWWICIGSWESRMADVADSERRVRRSDQQVKRINDMRRGWRRCAAAIRARGEQP